MEILSVLLMLLAVLLFIIGIVMLIVKAIKHKKKKPAVLTILLSVVIIIISIIIMPVDTATPNGGSDYTETEVFASEFCMAYMNSLKNPYSFTVKSVWANDKGDGTFEVYVKFTAENSIGGTVTEEIGTMGSLSEADLDKLAEGGEYVSVYTWGSEPSGKIIGEGQDLDASKIQNYINNNYK